MDSSPSIGPDGTIYIGCSDHYLYAVNPEGTGKYAYPLNGPPYSNSSAVGADGTIYMSCQGVGDHYLYALTPSFSLKWQIKNVDGTPVVGADGTIYATGIDPTGNYYCLYALRPDGTTKWPNPFSSGDYRFTTPTLGADGVIYMGTKGGFYALRPNGTIKWQYVVGTESFYYSAIGAGGVIYVGCTDGYVHAVNPDGTFKWKYYIGATVNKSPAANSAPAIGVDGTIFVNAYTNNYLYALNPNGSLKWKYACGGIQNASSPAIGPDGTVYFMAEGLQAVYSSCGGLAKTRWPMFQRNLLHTGRASNIAITGALYDLLLTN